MQSKSPQRYEERIASITMGSKTGQSAVILRTQSALNLIGIHSNAGAIEGQTLVVNREEISPLTHQTENCQGGRYPTCNMLVRKQFCHFQSGYKIPFREDTDLAFSILEGGFSIPFAQDLIVYHPP